MADESLQALDRDAHPYEAERQAPSTAARGLQVGEPEHEQAIREQVLELVEALRRRFGWLRSEREIEHEHDPHDACT